MASTTTTDGNGALVTNSAARLRYFLGQLLTQRDLQAEQRYHLMLRRLMQREVLGTGTVAGLEVRFAPAPPERDRMVVLAAGLGIDPDGRELLLESDILLDIAAAALAPNPAPFPPSTTPDSAAVLASDTRVRFALGAGTVFDATNVDSLLARATAAGLIVAGPTALASLRTEIGRVSAAVPNPLVGTFEDWLFDQMVGITHLGLQYRESGAEPSPAVGGSSCCAGVTCLPARTQEGVLIVAGAAAFPAVADPHAQFLTCLGTPPAITTAADCVALKTKLCQCAFDLWRDIPGVEDACGDATLPVVPLAVVNWAKVSRVGGQILAIDNVSERLLALGVPALRALTEALAGCTAGLGGV